MPRLPCTNSGMRYLVRSVLTSEGVNRTMYGFKCAHCGGVGWHARRGSKARYCSRKCGHAATCGARVSLTCPVCAKKFSVRESRTSQPKCGRVCCSRKCKDAAQSLEGGTFAIRPPQYGDGKYAYRTRALRYYGAACQVCGYARHRSMLDVHHKYADRSNNAIENLEVLCTWCHSLRTRGVQFHAHNGDYSHGDG